MKKKQTKKRKKQKQKLPKIRISISDSSGKKKVKPFDKSTYRHPTGKISAAFLEYVNHILDLSAVPRPPLKDANEVLKLASDVWNAVVTDMIKGETKYVDELRANAQDVMQLVNIEVLIQLKMTDFGDDLRLIGYYNCIPEEDYYRLQVAAVFLPELGPPPEPLSFL